MEENKNFVFKKKDDIASPEREARAKALSDFCDQNGNEVSFIDKGIDLKEASMEKDILKKIDSSGIELSETFLGFIKEYLAGPLFTDQFHEDHNSRRKWEKEIENKIDKDIYDFYSKNRMGVNNSGTIIVFLDLFIESIKDINLKNKFLDFKKSLPTEIIERNGEGFLKYHFLKDEEKIKIIQKITSVMSEIFSILTKE